MKLPSLDTTVTAIVGLSAIAMAATVVSREFRQAEQTSTGLSAPIYVDGWEDYLKAAIPLGSEAAAIQVIEFADLECPYCRRMDASLRAVSRSLGDEFSLSFMHYPLPNHTSALPAARALECAALQRSAKGLMEKVYDHQEELGVIPLTAFAERAAIPDLAAFAQCLGSGQVFERIDAGLAIGEEIGVRGVPTLLVNGWMLPPGADSTDIMIAVNDIRAGRRPSWGEDAR